MEESMRDIFIEMNNFQPSKINDDDEFASLFFFFLQIRTLYQLFKWKCTNECIKLNHWVFFVCSSRFKYYMKNETFRIAVLHL